MSTDCDSLAYEHAHGDILAVALAVDVVLDLQRPGEDCQQNAKRAALKTAHIAQVYASRLPAGVSSRSTGLFVNGNLTILHEGTCPW